MIIRKATESDAESIAIFMMLAMEDIVYQFIKKDDYSIAYNLLLHFVKQAHNLYSYQNCWVVELDGKIIASINCYDGAQFLQLREPFITYVKSHFNSDFNPENETEAGEWYIDTLGVSPEWQGKGIGTQLLQFLIEQHVIRNGETLGLLVDNANPNAKRLYQQLGFKTVGMKTLGGKQLEHLQLKQSDL